jgi:hypothetical protein
LSERLTRPRYERAVIINNPSGEEKAEDIAEELSESGVVESIMRLRSLAGGIEPNAELLANNLEPGDVICTVCGDGTFGTIVSAVRSAEVAESGNGLVPICPIDGGNANDVRRAMHGRRKRAPSWILRNGIEVPAYTVERTVKYEDETTRDEAVSYFGYGKTAEASRHLASPEYRLGRFVVRDIKLALATLFGDGSFEMQDEDGEARYLGDITVAKGATMAKVGRFGVRHYEQRMIVAETGRSWLAGTIGAAAIIAGMPYGKSRTEYGFRALTSVLAHRDGEPPEVILPGSEVSMAVSDDPYTLVTTRSVDRELLSA